MQRFYKYSDPLKGSWTVARGESRVCKFEGCGRWHKAKGYCDGHYVQVYKRGVEPFPLGRCGKDKACLYCERAAVKMGLCSTHYGRLQRGTKMDRPVIAPGQPRLDWSDPESTRNIAIAGAHARIARQWGPAKNYPCLECGCPAVEWAYDGTDPSQKLGRHGTRGNMMWYSVYPEFYMPMCKKCHGSRDGALVSKELEEYRIWKHSTGLSLGRTA